MRFVETPVFTAALRRHLDDETYRVLQLALLLRPTQGPIIQDGAGLRKLRWAATGRGKRGGVRLIYYWEAASQTFYMLYIEEPFRHWLRAEAEEVRPDARPQAWKNRRRIRWNTLRILSGRERRRWLRIVCRSRIVMLDRLLGQE